MGGTSLYLGVCVVTCRIACFMAMDVELKKPGDPTSPDTEWKNTQRNVFSRWCNYYLKKRDMYLYHITDFEDGLNLINLLEELSAKKITGYNKKPIFRPQKLENIAIALKFIEDQHIKLVNIDATDILKKKEKLVTGLIWTLILKYQITENPYDDVDTGIANKVTPKQYMLLWAQHKLSSLPHFTDPQEKMDVKSFGDGKTLCALLEALKTGSCPEYKAMDRKHNLKNARHALDRAEVLFDVPQIITPEEITNPNVDELSILTYLGMLKEKVNSYFMKKLEAKTINN